MTSSLHSVIKSFSLLVSISSKSKGFMKDHRVSLAMMIGVGSEKFLYEDVLIVDLSLHIPPARLGRCCPGFTLSSILNP